MYSIARDRILYRMCVRVNAPPSSSRAGRSAQIEWLYYTKTEIDSTLSCHSPTAQIYNDDYSLHHRALGDLVARHVRIVEGVASGVHKGVCILHSIIIALLH